MYVEINVDVTNIFFSSSSSSDYSIMLNWFVFLSYSLFIIISQCQWWSIWCWLWWWWWQNHKKWNNHVLFLIDLWFQHIYQSHHWHFGHILLLLMMMTISSYRYNLIIYTIQTLDDDDDQEVCQNKYHIHTHTPLIDGINQQKKHKTRKCLVYKWNV